MPKSQRNNRIDALSIEDKDRLQKIAPEFGIELHQVNDDEYELRHVDDPYGERVVVPASVAHKRLLLEVCSCAAPWVYFHLRESCRDSLLNITDARLERIAELYRQQKAKEKKKPVGVLETTFLFPLPTVTTRNLP